MTEHPIAREKISKNAITVIKRLNSQGFQAYLVGGSVRDLLLNKTPKDFDIVTNALPEQVRSLFTRSRIIGRRFRLVHVYFTREVIEVSTFRANINQEVMKCGHDNGLLEENEFSEKFMLMDDNTYGTIEEDAWRRDFTVNALYYAPNQPKVIDYTNGLNDINTKVIRVIGDPRHRFHEDPGRLLRAIRLAAKLGFIIEEQAYQQLLDLRKLLIHLPPARLFDEVIKLFFYGHAQETYQFLQQTNYFESLFPATAQLLKKNKGNNQELINIAIVATDRRFHSNKTLNPGFLLATLLWGVLQQRIQDYKNRQKKEIGQ